MNSTKALLLAAAWCTALGLGENSSAEPLSAEQQAWLAKAHRAEKAGWVYLHIEGDPFERGFQRGYLISHEIADGLHTTRFSWTHQSAMEWKWLAERAGMSLSPKIDAEDLAEIDGMVAGLRAAGHFVSRDDLIAYNAWYELLWYWWPGELRKLKENPAESLVAVHESCSSFIATGSSTADGNVVLGHNSMQSYCDVLPRVIENIKPSHGHQILWQTYPGWIHSGTDFFITDAGLVGSETTLGGFEGYETNGIPEFVRMRRATQDAGGIEEWCQLMRLGNNGGYANAWLLGDINTKEIARLELGLKHIGFEKKRDGFFTGSNVAEDPKILRLETSTDETDIRSSGVARRVRWKQLLQDNNGKINLALAKRFEADHYDTLRGKYQLTARTLCGHFDLDPDPQIPWPGVPYGCCGTVDGKVVDSSMARNLSFAARWGAACGTAFNSRKFLTAHPQFDWMQPILKDRPSEPWTTFRAGE
ncbi:MAG TPA: C45 family autoproteolytic acyltransferase/hydrolase [Verrucomicrobiae bacterium]|nr:C45 family autoproteolytic acyltransferase/hydrolase [Verrucomicrobiae bacterium]